MILDVAGDALVSVFASNCKNAGASDRSKFLEDFMELVPVRLCTVHIPTFIQ